MILMTSSHDPSAARPSRQRQLQNNPSSTSYRAQSYEGEHRPTVVPLACIECTRPEARSNRCTSATSLATDGLPVPICRLFSGKKRHVVLGDDIPG